MRSRLEWKRGALGALAALTLVVAACGGDEDGAAGDGMTDASGAPEAERSAETGSAPYDITVAEFIAELQPDKQRILDALIAEGRACKGVEVDSSFVLLITAAGLKADQGSPLPDLVEEQC